MFSSTTISSRELHAKKTLEGISHTAEPIVTFERAEQERLLMIQRIKNGKEVSDNTQGRPVGSKNKTTEKESKIKQTIKELSKDFYGTLTDEKIIKESLVIFLDCAIPDRLSDKRYDLSKYTDENTSEATYVWLPIRFNEKGIPYICWEDEWKIEDFE